MRMSGLPKRTNSFFRLLASESEKQQSEISNIICCNTICRYGLHKYELGWN